VHVVLGLTYQEECRLSVFENRVLRRIFGFKREAAIAEKSFTVKNSMICTVHQILGCSHQGE
jgi:hypothetical protein